MASAVIHICVAKKINEYLKINMNEAHLLLGSIAPDVGQQIGIDKKYTHFITGDVKGVPNLDLFLQKYNSDLKNAFTIGYFIHLLTDYYWFLEFVPNFIKENNITREEFISRIYNDYTNLNVRLIDYYKLSLSMFYENIPIINTAISEIPLDKLPVLIDKIRSVIESSKIGKLEMVNFDEIIFFIEDASKKIIQIFIKELNT